MRKATIKRQTSETKVTLNFVVDGKGKRKITTGVPFLDHMLDLFTQHGHFDMTLTAKGDIDIDAHHGDGMYYPFQDDPYLIFADVHQDGRTIYPGTGDRSEIGTGQAKGTKLNIPLPVGANDGHFQRAWTEIQDHLERYQPEFIILQCSADSLAGDPITQLELSEKSHHMAAKSLSLIAEKYCQGKLVALGGGGYNLDNIAKAWTAVVEGLID